jgi:hypothetical protein
MTRQRLNTRSSTEGELVDVSDVLPQVLWTRYFLTEQGYDEKDSIVYQYNQSAIYLEKNGRVSSSKRTRHINIRYFFVADRIGVGELRIFIAQQPRCLLISLPNDCKVACFESSRTKS